MELMTSEQMRNVDRRAIEDMGIPGLDLMENAGNSVADFIDNLLVDYENPSISVICGKGNNGGDGFVAARHLSDMGYAVQCFLLSKPEALKGDAAVNYNRAIANGILVKVIESPDELMLPPNTDLIVDSIFGTGFKGQIKGLAADIIKKINDLLIPVVSVDCPSGVDASTGEVSTPCVIADYTITFGRPKLGLYFPPGRDYAGVVHTVDIGIPDEAVEAEKINLFLTTPEYLHFNLPKRPSNGYKGTFGYLYVLAGSVGLTGSASLTSESALRTGCGMVRLGCPSSLNDIFEVKLTEVMTSPLPEVRKKRCLALRGLGEIRKDIRDWADAVALGPGLGTHFETKELIRRLVPSLKLPTVIDADAINNLAGADEVFQQIDFPCVLTPHPGELSRLMGKPIDELTKDRFTTLREATKRFGVVIVFKGSPMLIGEPSGRIYVSPVGNSGMGTAGAGDVLTGIIGSLLAQGMDAFPAAICGTYILGAAGDFALTMYGNRGLIAGDIKESIPDVLMDFE